MLGGKTDLNSLGVRRRNLFDVTSPKLSIRCWKDILRDRFPVGFCKIAYLVIPGVVKVYTLKIMPRVVSPFILSQTNHHIGVEAGKGTGRIHQRISVFLRMLYDDNNRSVRLLSCVQERYANELVKEDVVSI